MNWNLSSLVILAVLAIDGAGVAKDKPPPPTPQYTCEDVRAAVAIAGGIDNAIKMVRSRKNPADEALIQEATRRCLK